MKARAWLLAAVLALGACASAPSPLDAAVVTANGAAAVATSGETTLARLYESEQHRCLDEHEKAAAARACVVEVRARYRPAWRAYDALRATWIASAALITAARATERSGRAPDLGQVASVVSDLIAAEQALAAAVNEARGKR